MIEGKNIRYVQFETSQGTGYGCYSIQWSRENGELKCEIGSSYCSPKDSFSKNLARTIATGRLEVNSQTGSIKSESVGYITDNDFNLVLNELFKDKTFSIIPNWARRAFNKGDYTFSLRKATYFLDESFGLITETLNASRKSLKDLGKLISEKDMKSWEELFTQAQQDPDFMIVANPSNGK